MGRFRQEMREARAQVHDFMSVPAFCFMDPAEVNPRLATVRVHEKWLALGDLKGTNFNYAEVEEMTPRIIFWRANFIPVRKMFVSIEAGVAFQIDTVLPPDDVTVTATAARLQVEKTTRFPVPPVTL